MQWKVPAQIPLTCEDLVTVFAGVAVTGGLQVVLQGFRRGILAVAFHASEIPVADARQPFNTGSWMAPNIVITTDL